MSETLALTLATTASLGQLAEITRNHRVKIKAKIVRRRIIVTSLDHDSDVIMRQQIEALGLEWWRV